MKNYQPTKYFLENEIYFQEATTMDISSIKFVAVNQDNDLQSTIDFETKTLKLDNLEEFPNAIIGKNNTDKIETIQIMPWDYRSCEANRGQIVIYILVHSHLSKSLLYLIYDELYQLSSYLIKLYNLNPTSIIWDNVENLNDQLMRVKYTMDTLYTRLELDCKPKEEDIKVSKFYRIRRAWNEPIGQKGPYTKLQEAKMKLKTLDSNWYIFNDFGDIVYPEIKIIPIKYKNGTSVKLLPEATFINDKKIPTWLFNCVLYVKNTYPNGDISLSTTLNGDNIGFVHSDYVEEYEYCADIKPNTQEEIKIGNKVRINDSQATFFNGIKVPKSLLKATMIVREAPRANGDIVLSKENGTLVGVINKEYLELAEAPILRKIRINSNLLNVYKEPGDTIVIAQMAKNEIYEIYEISNYWGKTVKGWIDLRSTSRIK